MKKISELSDEDALKVEMIRMDNKEYTKDVMIRYGREYVEKSKNNMRVDVYQYLQAKGYDLPKYY